MKRFYLGLGILAVLLAAAVLTTGFMTRCHEDISLSLEQSARCAGERDWDSADFFLALAKADWEKWAHLRCCLADHEPTENVDAAFAALEVYRARRESPAYTAACASLARQIAAIGEAHSLSWWNVL